MLSVRKHATLIARLFQSTPRWNSPCTMYNVAPPPLLPSVVAKSFSGLYNPNLALDTASGISLVTEQKIIHAVAKYIGWPEQKVGGIFTSGGKATILYGIKIGLKNCCPDSSMKGINEDVVVLSTSTGHPSHISNADWLGIGSSNVIRINTSVDGKVDLREMEKTIRKLATDHKKIAAIIISAGSTNSMIVDPIRKVVSLRNKLKKELGLKYKPHIHADAVLAFPWIFFKNYNFHLNHLKIQHEALKRISAISKDLIDLSMVDSFGIDFHKMGYCPYVSSVFMIKDKTLLTGLKNLHRWPFMYTLENTRPADGINSAYIALNVLGVKGFQLLIGHITEMAVHLQHKIESTCQFDIINKIGLGSSVMFVPRPPTKYSDDTMDNINIRNTYTEYFVEQLSKLKNPYYIDKIPGDSTGGSPCPYTSLKTYIISPFSSKKITLNL